MSLTSGEVGSAVIGSDHVDWVCKYLQVKTNLINEDLLNSILTGNFQNPMVRVYSEDATTGVQTEIVGMSFISIRNNKRSTKGTFSATLKPEKLGASYTTLYETELPANNTKYFVVKAGYIFEGSEILVPILKGVIKDRRPTYGRASTSINFNGFDFAELLDQTIGVFNGYATAKTLMTYVLNLAGLNAADFSQFTDFSISGVDFNNNTGLEVVERLSTYKGEFTFYFSGAGTLVVKDLPTDTDSKYTYPSTNLQGFSPTSSSRDKITEVVINGTNVAITRQTDSTDRAKWGGINRVNLQNSIITTTSAAETAGDNLINESRKEKGSFNAVYNPFLYIDDIITTDFADSGDTKYRIEGVTHTFRATDNTLSTRSRLAVEDVDYTAPTITTV